MSVKHKNLNRIVNHKMIVRLTILLMLFIVFYFFRLTAIVGESMEPTLLNGERGIVILNRFDIYSPSRNDIVLVRKSTYDNKVLIKRVVGLPGDVIEIKDNQLFLNSVLYEEPYIKEEMYTLDLKVELGENEIFVLGDNRNNSVDSRLPNIGVVKVDEEVIGKLIYTFN